MFSLEIEVQSTLLAMIVFAVVSYPGTYKLVQSLLGGVLGKIADSSGCPTTTVKIKKHNTEHIDFHNDAG